MIKFVRSFVLLIIFSAISEAHMVIKTSEYKFGEPFNSSYYGRFEVIPPAMISNKALQITPDSAGNFNLTHQSGRVLYNNSFKLWEQDPNHNLSQNSWVASFNSSFLVNVFRVSNDSAPGEGMAFIIAPDLDLPPGSDGQYLGLTNSTTDGNADNNLVAVELDTFKQDFDPDDNHMGLNINSVKSVKNVSLSNFGIQISPPGAVVYMIWVEYDGKNKMLNVFMAERGKSKPAMAVLTADLDISQIVKQNSYFGFAASTGSNVELNCVLGWNLTVEEVQEQGRNGGNTAALKVGLAVGVPAAVLAAVAVVGLVYYLRRRRAAAASDANILGALQSLPGMPREFRFRDLKKATNNFDEKNKLGQGGFGIVYKGVLAMDNLEVAVKKFSRDNMKGKDDFLSELTIINRLRHKHLVRLLGWCHKNGMLLLVYEYMPNGSLDNHLYYASEEEKRLEWNQRYKIITGVASALHYLHNEYDQKVVHRDLKASNIMLDSNFNARLGDFGLARALENEKTSYAELEQQGVPGTIGYIAPECFHTGKATRESDVYAFGAVLLEVVCGQRPSTKIESYPVLVDWVWWLHREGRILDAVDERLGSDYVAEEAERLLLLGLACSHPIASKRPKAQAILQIIVSGGSQGMPDVPHFKPSFVWPSTMPGAGDDEDKGNTADTIPMTSSSYYGSEWTPQYLSRESYTGFTDSSLA